MKRIEIQLKAEERRRLAILSTSGVCQVRELQRAQVLGIDRTRIWRIRQRYLSGGLAQALSDQSRPGRPREYDDKAEADLVAFACSEPPTGYSRWSIALLTL